MMKNLFIALMTCSLLAGCQLTRVEGEYQDVEVKVNTKGDKYDRYYDNHRTSRFCPPGQAKKGRC